MTCKIGEFIFTHLPVAAIGIAAVIIACLPSVVYNHSFHSGQGRQPALGLDIAGCQLLMKLIPA